MKDQQKTKNVAERAELLLRETVEGLGYILWDVEFKKEGADYNLILTIDGEGELTLDDCVRVTDSVNPILDEADPIQQSYCLEVSSAGLERELRRPEHFEKYLGEEVEVRLFAPHEKLGKAFQAILAGYSPEGYTFRIGGEEIALEKSRVSSVKNVVDFATIFKNN